MAATKTLLPFIMFIVSGVSFMTSAKQNNSFWSNHPKLIFFFPEMWKFQSKPKRNVRKVELNSLQRLERKREHKRKGKKNQEKERVRITLLFNLLLNLKSRFGSVVTKLEMLVVHYLPQNSESNFVSTKRRFSEINGTSWKVV